MEGHPRNNIRRKLKDPVSFYHELEYTIDHIQGCKKTVCSSFKGHRMHYNGKEYCEKKYCKIKVDLTPQQKIRANRIVKCMSSELPN